MRTINYIYGVFKEIYLQYLPPYSIIQASTWSPQWTILKDILKSFGRFFSKQIQFVVLGINSDFCKSGMAMLSKNPLAVHEAVANWRLGFAGVGKMRRRFSQKLF